MPARKLTDINLLPKDSFESSNLGKALKWVLVTGRVIMVLTMLVVIVGFLSRFWFDVRLNDLNESVIQKQNIVRSYADIEKEMRDTQVREERINNYLTNNLRLEIVYNDLVRALPQDVSLTDLSISSETISLKGFARSETGFAGFLSNIGKGEKITSVRLGKTTFSQKTGVIDFGITATLNRQEAKK